MGELKPDMVVNVCNPSIRRKRQKDCKLEVSLDYIEKPCLKKVGEFIFSLYKPQYLNGKD
jgi:hypothetical protein